MKYIITTIMLACLSFNTVANVCFSPAPPPLEQGVYVDENYPGMGFLVFEFGVGFVAWWFVYDNQGNQEWYVTDTQMQHSCLGVEFLLFKPRGVGRTTEDFELGRAVGVAVMSGNMFSYEFFGGVTDFVSQDCVGKEEEQDLDCRGFFDIFRLPQNGVVE